MTTTRHALNSEYALISEMRLITGKYGIVEYRLTFNVLKMAIALLHELYNLCNTISGTQFSMINSNVELYICQLYAASWSCDQ